MSVLRTRTPRYRGQPPRKSEPAPSRNLCDWIAGLARTATPDYAEPEPVIGKDEPAEEDRPQVQRR